MPRQGESLVFLGTGCILWKCQTSETEQSKHGHLCLTENWGTEKYSDLFQVPCGNLGLMSLWKGHVFVYHGMPVTERCWNC